jgi:Transcriptional regulator, AbiEi antitoxin
MDNRVSTLLRVQGGVAGWSQLASLGASPSDVQSWVRAGRLVRVRRGAYADPAVWGGARPGERYRLTVEATLRARGEGVASRHSALALWELPLYDVDRRLVVLSADVEETTTHAGLRIRPLRGLVATSEVRGLAAECVPDAVVTTSATSVLAGVVAGDAALHRGLCRLEDLVDAVDRLAPSLRCRRRVKQVLEAVDASCESPGESRTRLLLKGSGLPVEPQAEIRDELGAFVARVDFLVAGRVVVEFDGAVKYAAEGGREALVAEKRREDRLRSLGYAVVRITWRELERPDLVLHRVRLALQRTAA